MKPIFRRIEASLERLGGDADHQSSAMLEIREGLDSIPDSSLEREIHCILAEAASELEESEKLPPPWKEAPPSHRFQRLRDKYTEAVDHHPAFALRLGRIADAFAAVGL